jgi:hypothetical protein
MIRLRRKVISRNFVPSSSHAKIILSDIKVQLPQPAVCPARLRRMGGVINFLFQIRNAWPLEEYSAVDFSEIWLLF